MKLRNKITGEIKEAEARDDGIYLYSVETEQWFKYDLDILAEGWEYYIEPKEPLIKDEKIRKAVRAWAYCNLLYDDDRVFLSKPTFDCKILSLEHGMLNFDVYYDDESLCNKHYTIAELCGEEE